MTHPLFDTARWVRNLEKGLLEAWLFHQQQGIKRHIDVKED